jgi:elongation factor 1-beta
MDTLLPLHLLVMNAAMVRVSKQATRHRRSKHADTNLPSHLIHFFFTFVLFLLDTTKNLILMAIISYTPSQADVHVYSALGKAPSSQYPHSLRWYNHITSYAKEHTSLPGSSTPGQKFTSGAAAKAPAAEADDDDDIDLFGEDEEEDAEAERVKAERVKAYEAKKAAKPKTIAKVGSSNFFRLANCINPYQSVVTLEVKPWDDETDMGELEKAVRAIEQDGLVWGSSKLVAIGYGIKKLQMTLVIGQ